MHNHTCTHTHTQRHTLTSKWDITPGIVLYQLLFNKAKCVLCHSYSLCFIIASMSFITDTVLYNDVITLTSHTVAPLSVSLSLSHLQSVPPYHSYSLFSSQLQSVLHYSNSLSLLITATVCSYHSYSLFFITVTVCPYHGESLHFNTANLSFITDTVLFHAASLSHPGCFLFQVVSV